jgi:ribosomal protein L29
MKKKDINDLRSKSIADLVKLVGEKKLELAKVSVEMKTSQEKNIKKARNLRDEIAKISTIIREKQIFEQSAKS